MVGAVLVAINHGDALLCGDVSPGRALRIILTALVPYCVSTYSSVELGHNHPHTIIVATGSALCQANGA